MNSIRKVNEINQRELANNVSDEASWHYDYRDTLYIFIGSLHTDLAEIDIIKIFSQYGIPTHINLVKDRDLGKSRGFAYLKYRNFKSCVLAIDNLNGIKLMDRPIKVDHVYYKLKDGEREEDYEIDYSDAIATIEEKKYEKPKEQKLLEYEDDELKDPMEAFLKEKEDERDHKRRSSHKDHKSRHRSHRDEDRKRSRPDRCHRSHSDGHSHRTEDKSHRRSEDKSRHGHNTKDGDHKVTFDDE